MADTRTPWDRAQPFLLVAFTALVSGVFVFWVTQVPFENARRDAARYEAELALRADLVARAARSDGEFFAYLHLYGGERERNAAALNRAYRAWEGRSHELALLLRTYYPNGVATAQWSEYVFAMRYVYWLLRDPPIVKRIFALRRLAAALGHDGVSNLNGLLDSPTKPDGSPNPSYFDDLERLVTDLRAKEARVLATLRREESAL